eukprot:jgi/Botrbrau1/11972/Bobra.0115s0008.1
MGPGPETIEDVKAALESRYRRECCQRIWTNSPACSKRKWGSGDCEVPDRRWGGCWATE